MIKTFFINSTQAQYTDEEFSFIQTQLMRAGIFGDNSGVLGLQVTQNSPLAMSVLVSAGKALVSLTKSGVTWNVIMVNTASQAVTIPANSSGSNRVDAIIVRVDKDTEPNTLKTNVATIELVQGTGVSALSDGAITTAVGSDGWYRLANVTVANGASTIANAVIADTRGQVAVNSAVTFDFLSSLLTLSSATKAGYTINQTTRNDVTAIGEANATTKRNKIGQSFIADTSTIRGVTLYKEANTGTFTGTVTVSIQADSAGAPSGSDLASVVLTNAQWLGIATGEIELPFTAEATTTVGATYWIIVTTSTSDTSNHPNISINTAGGYANGSLKYNNTTDGWVATTTDLYFKILEGKFSKLAQVPTSGVLPVNVLPVGLIDTNVATTSVSPSQSNSASVIAYSKYLPAEFFKLNSGFKIRGGFSASARCGNSYAEAVIRIKLNGTTVASYIGASSSNGSTADFDGAVKYDFMVLNNASLAVQRIIQECFTISTQTLTNNTDRKAFRGYSLNDVGTSTVDTSAGCLLEIEIYAQNGSLGSGSNVTMKSIILEKIGQ